MSFFRTQTNRNLRSVLKTFLSAFVFFFLYIMYDVNVRFQEELVLRDAEIEKIKREIAWPIPSRTIDFEGFDNETGFESGCYVVPNYVHFVKFDERAFSFVEMLCVLAAYKRQRPEKLFIHTNVNELRGKYWDVLKEVRGISNVLYTNYMNVPGYVGRTPLSSVWKRQHARDIVRLNILADFGGVFLDNDVFLVRSIDDLRRFEMVVGWKPGRTMGNQVLMAHKDARFLKEVLKSYETQYLPDDRTYNAVVWPTQEVLEKRPYLVHRVEEHLGIYERTQNVFSSGWDGWRGYYTLRLTADIHPQKTSTNGSLLHPETFEDHDLGNYRSVAFYDMVKDIYDVDKEEPL